MNFKDMAKSGEFNFSVPEFEHSVEKGGKSRMAGEYMEKFHTQTDYQPQSKSTFDQNATAYGIGNPYEDYISDQAYKRDLDTTERRKDWKHDNT